MTDEIPSYVTPQDVDYIRNLIQQVNRLQLENEILEQKCESLCVESICKDSRLRWLENQLAMRS